MLEQQIAVLEKLIELHGNELTTQHVLNYIEYLKHRARMTEDEVCCWDEYFGRLP